MERIVRENSQWVYLHCSPVSWLHSVLLNREIERNEDEVYTREEDGKTNEKRALAVSREERRIGSVTMMDKENEESESNKERVKWQDRG